MDLEKFDRLWKEMRAEVYAVQEWAHAEPESDLRKRALVRSMASYIESCVNALAEAMLENTDPTIPALYCVLSETQFDLSEHGIVKKRAKQFPTISRWRFLVRAIEHTIGTNHWKVEFAQNGFNDLKVLFRIRNRITHPRASESMRVTIEEMKKCVSGFTWFVTNHQGICKVPRKGIGNAGRSNIS